MSLPVALAGVKDEQTRYALEQIALKLGELKQFIFWGTGSPNTVVTASVGAIFLRLDGGAGTSIYIKESGTSTNTGWIAK
jgi:hypothetical protein